MIVRRLSGFGYSYTVQEGDTVEAIAAAAGIPWKAIATANGFPSDATFIDGTLLTPGQSISVPAAGGAPGPSVAGALPWVAGALALLGAAAFAVPRILPRAKPS